MYGDYFSAIKNMNFIGENDIFKMFAQNIDCGYTLELPRRDGVIAQPQSAR